MLSGVASQTARAVATVRAGAQRVSAPFGNPAADDALQRLVAGSAAPPEGPMYRYLLARTGFFDRAVVAADDSGIEQVVVAAAGYDGRAMRYAKPGVRWFELDHPDTQADKRARLAELGLAPGAVRFVAADFATDDVRARLAEAGCDPGRRSLVLAEGIAVYLEPPVLTALLGALRRSVAADSQLVISLSVAVSDPDQQARRAAFQRRVAALGEPARTTLSADTAEQLFTDTGWRTIPTPTNADPARRAGFVVVTATATATRGPQEVVP